MSIFESRAEKKKKQLKKNKYQQMLYEFVRLRRVEYARVKEEVHQRKVTKVEDAKDENDMVWSSQVVSIRNRLTDKKRVSKERWNRFSGTSDAGGRGL